MEKINWFELRRQAFHILLGIAVVAMVTLGFLNENGVLMVIVVGFILSFVSRRARLPLISKLIGIFERQKEIDRFPGRGIIFYFAGVYAVLLLFPQDIAVASIMVLALGDSVSHLFGLHFGKIKHPLSSAKFIEGTIAGFVAGFMGALIFVSTVEAFFASLAAMLVEAVEIKIGTRQVDDNLIVPIVAAGVIWLVRLI